MSYSILDIFRRLLNIEFVRQHDQKSFNYCFLRLLHVFTSQFCQVRYGRTMLQDFQGLNNSSRPLLMIICSMQSHCVPNCIGTRMKHCQNQREGQLVVSCDLVNSQLAIYLTFDCQLRLEICLVFSNHVFFDSQTFFYFCVLNEFG